MGHPVRIPESSISAALHARSREPFTDVLTALIGARPDPKALKFFADRYPHKWAQAVAIFARLAGYHEKMEVKGNIALDISGMSDAELMERLARHRMQRHAELARRHIGERRDIIGNLAAPIERHNRLRDLFENALVVNLAGHNGMAFVPALDLIGYSLLGFLTTTLNRLHPSRARTRK